MHDLQAAADAYRGLELPDETQSYVVPPRWTPEHAAVRLCHALDVIGRTTRRPGPRALRSVWPEAIGGWRGWLDADEQRRAAEDAKARHRRLKLKGPVRIDWRAYVPADVVSAFEQDAAEAAARRKDAPPANEIAFAEEAALWPARHLADKPLAARALLLFALSQAFELNVAKTIRREAERPETHARILTRKAFDHHRKLGADCLARRLTAARTPVR